MKYYDVFFDNDGAHEPLTIKGNIDVSKITDDRAALETVKEFMRGAIEKCLREPVGDMKYKFVVPGAEYQDLWDWDSFFMCCALPDSKLDYAEGTIKGLLDAAGENGQSAKMVTRDGKILRNPQTIPILAQFTYIVSKRMNDFSWVGVYWDKLERVMEYYDNTFMRNGFYIWLQWNGIDNNPSLYGQEPNTVAGADLAAWIYRELKAMEKLSAKLGREREGFYAQKAESLKKFIQNNYFDYADGFFYDVLRNTDNVKIPKMFQAIKWNTFIKFKNWSSVFPLWGKAASCEQAAEVVKKMMLPDEFLSCCGIRSHSKNDMVYNNEPMGNPSNWQGPVWGLSTFLTAYSMSRYGYKKEALDAAYRLIRTYAADIEQNGCTHEFYHGETGQPLMRPYFLSWNVLALKVIDDIENGTDCTTLDILD